MSIWQRKLGQGSVPRVPFRGERRERCSSPSAPAHGAGPAPCATKYGTGVPIIAVVAGEPCAQALQYRTCATEAFAEEVG
eukprot:CAMPEP_0174336114 /NCGR_PEP_ID=MMETSP0810-20121108/21317_1 /TAXON_ID=73025 ORGANISM="Eutreptiella gymnastica-like, Strain CCMP1594" /NCGR_SAMPLE_ID=MMETSP0810 /ASSEMBLY_ACC=CAM_ASM_000659 /LENGTH=79 /DNA_ID=CAMNT_0015454885 /DNA_START=270 /DNA_END=505 /DNA_ORIENTATION=+